MSQKPKFSPKYKAGFILVGIAFLAIPIVSEKINPGAYQGGRSRDEVSRRERNSSAIGTILGEFRATFSDVVFIKTERYLHGGIAYQSHVNVSSVSVDDELERYNEHQSEVGEDGHHEHDGHDHGDDEMIDFDDEGSGTVIPTAETDFRGIIGTMEREIKPWRDPSLPHIHSDGKELLPWYRVMTVSDPTNIRAYIIGNSWLTRQAKVDEALAFLDEGIEHNPEQFQLYYYKGKLLVDLMREEDRTLAVPELLADFDEALELFVKSAELSVISRPKVFDMREGKTNPSVWTHYMEDDMGATMRMAVILMRRDNQLERALKFAEEMAPKTSFIDEEGQFYPQDTKLTEYISELREELGY